MTLAERFCAAGVPVFVPDMKGDILALARSCPTIAHDLFGESGVPLRAAVDDIGPELMSRSLSLSDSQAGVLDVADVYAPRARMPLSTIDDLRRVMAAMVANRHEVSARIGLVSPVSVGAIQRALLRLERRGGASFFQDPTFPISTLLRMEAGRGLVSVLAADKLILQPDVYSMFLLWMLSELFERLPEVGDLDRPRLVFFFDEAHLLFANCPAPLLRRIEQVVRLVRSKGVGVYFVTQTRDDVPKVIREQLALRIDHARRLGVGCAHVVTLGESGKPNPVDLVRVDLPSCRLGALTDAERVRLLPRVPRMAPPAPASTPRASAIVTAATALVVAVALGLIVWSGKTPYALAVFAGICLAVGWPLASLLSFALAMLTS
jgi:hypothetical protein